MRLPEKYTEITPKRIENSYFPPSGTVLFEEGNDGAGDYFCLYWPIGQEDETPHVFHLNHEESILEPIHYDLTAFLNNLDLETGEVLVYPGLRDENYFLSCFQRAKVFSKKDTVEATRLLKRSTELFPEYSDNWYWLLKLTDKSEVKKRLKYAIRCFCSNWAFGLPNVEALKEILEIRNSGFEFDDPIFNRIGKSDKTENLLNLNFDSAELHEIAYDYMIKEDFVSFLLMLQNYIFFRALTTRKTGLTNLINEIKEVVDKYFPERKYS
ncbi:hypothetical protein Q4534_14715 [Cyclobacterium sp. 1_MG-2023]|uniref:hypothetical protein n=1 Tax=Cyclobacterium sp. 1_MG-2023 TaxID=3062681 RepID=UPI0026E37380|nr:hypothetical protein [Cyclobacterium sp. 1_MG-2023]MDO6438672.1 hypothetical protein [Cyclobacterium sp. 1_MG-2023]